MRTLNRQYNVLTVCLLYYTQTAILSFTQLHRLNSIIQKKKTFKKLKTTKYEYNIAHKKITV